MAKPNYAFAKRQRELAKKQKKEEKQTVAPSFSENIGRIKESFRADINPDIIIRRFAAGGRVEAAVVFMNGMADAETINDYVLRETMKKPLPDKPPYIDYMIKNVLTAGDVYRLTRRGLTVVQSVERRRGATCQLIPDQISCRRLEALRTRVSAWSSQLIWRRVRLMLWTQHAVADWH